MINRFTAILISISFLVALLSGCNEVSNNKDKNETVLEVHIPKTVYGIDVDTLQVINERVKKNEFLSDILLRYGVSYNDIDFIARKTKDIFDVRKIIAGNKYSVICTVDSIPNALYFAYELSPSKLIADFLPSAQVQP